MKVFLDTNVILDIFFQRQGAEASRLAISRCDGATHSAWIAWHSLSNAYYLVRGHTKLGATAQQFIIDLLSWAKVAETSTADAVRATTLGMPDFEDALQTAAALSCGADVIVTRNLPDFKASPLPVMTPEQFASLSKEDPLLQEPMDQDRHPPRP